MVYRALPGELPALQRAVARLQTVLAWRRRLRATPFERRGRDFDSQLLRCEEEALALAGAEERFDEAFGKAARRVLEAGGVAAQRLDTLLVEVPVLAARLRATEAALEALKASYASLGAAGAHADPEIPDESGPLGRGLLHRRRPVRLDRSRAKVASRLELSGQFAERAKLDPGVILAIGRVRALFAVGMRDGSRRHDVAVSAELRRVVRVVGETAEKLSRTSAGTGRALFELVAFA